MLRGIPREAVERVPRGLDGLIREENGRIALTERGLDLANTVFAAFLDCSAPEK
jgi:coproporphyrinogen III oxidase-like Fe-S oxidoreductase